MLVILPGARAMVVNEADVAPVACGALRRQRVTTSNEEENKNARCSRDGLEGRLGEEANFREGSRAGVCRS